MSQRCLGMGSRRPRVTSRLSFHYHPVIQWRTRSHETLARSRRSGRPGWLDHSSTCCGFAGLEAEHHFHPGGRPGLRGLLRYAASCRGHSHAEHRHDRRNGALFTNGYVSAPVCSPSRTGIITGRYQQRFNKEAGWRNAMPERATTIAEHLRGLGYATMMIGKNDFGIHLPSKEDRRYPINHGYDHVLGFDSHAPRLFPAHARIEEKAIRPHEGPSANVGPLDSTRAPRTTPADTRPRSSPMPPSTSRRRAPRRKSRSSSISPTTTFTTSSSSRPRSTSTRTASSQFRCMNRRWVRISTITTATTRSAST